MTRKRMVRLAGCLCTTLLPAIAIAANADSIANVAEELGFDAAQIAWIDAKAKSNPDFAREIENLQVEQVAEFLERYLPLMPGAISTDRDPQSPSRGLRVPANDDCVNAATAVDGDNAYDNTDSTLDPTAPTPSDSNMDDDIWFFYTASCTGDATIGTCEGTSGADTVLEVYDGCACGAAAVSIGQADDTPGCGASGYSSEVTIPVTNGSCYAIRLSGWNGGTVSGQLNIACSGPAACCFSDGSCETLGATDCATSNGVFQGGGSVCVPNTCPQPTPGDNCDSPITVSLPAELDYADFNTTIGRGDNYETTCMGSYDGGDDIIYELDVTSTVCVDITLDADTIWGGIGVDAACPLDPSSCVATATTSADPDVISGLLLTPGTYYLMADTFPSPQDMNFDLTINACPTGACCDGGSCLDISEAECDALGGAYLGDGVSCTPDPCATGACCELDGSCSDGTAGDCATSNGVYQGNGSNCGSTSCPQPCSCDVTTGGFCTEFGDDVSGSFGLWTNSTDDDHDWTLNQGGTVSSGTGPSGDHTTGSGFYAYYETSSPVAQGDVIALDGPCVDLSTLTNPAVTFWYHMFGAGMGTLEFQVSTNNCITWDTLFTQSGNQGDQWLLAQVDLAAYAGQTVHVRFVGIAGPAGGGGGFTFESDMAIDDICFDEFQVFQGACCNTDTGACIGTLTEADCANEPGNTNWTVAQDCVNGPFVCPPSPVGNDCSDPILVSLPADLAPDYVSVNTTCNRVDDYENTCMGSYDGGEDIVYELTVTDTVCINVAINSDTIWDGIGIDSACPLDGTTCIATATTSSTPDTISDLILDPGTYYLMADTFPSPECMDFDITIEACPTGACCSNGFCSVLTEAECGAVGGTYVGNDIPCTPDPCSVGACCISDGSCQLTDSNGCVTAGGTYSGNATSCTPNECPQPGDDCSNSLPVSLPADLGVPFADSTCGRGNNVEDPSDSATCMSFYTAGEDAFYGVTVTDTVCVDISLESDSTWTGISIDDGCPPDASCIGVSTSSATDELIERVLLTPGSYSVMIDTWPSPDCINAYTLGFNACPEGACCSNGICTVTSEPECAALGGVYAGDNTLCAGDDCNNNGQDDACEILEDPSVDCNDNDVPDDCDVSDGTSGDCNNNLVPDECDPDCNNNAVADECDISDGTSLDCQPDGVPDECQLGGARVDVVADGGFEAGTPNPSWNETSTNFGTPLCDLAGCGDGGGTAGPRTGSWWAWFGGIAAFEVATVDQSVTVPAGSATLEFYLWIGAGSGNGIDDLTVSMDATQVFSALENDATYAGGYTLVQVDVSAFADGGSHTLLFSSTSQGSGVSNFNVDDVAVVAGGVGAGGDCNANGVPDDCDISADTSEDCDTNGVPDECEFLDCDNSGIHDPCDILQGADDCNNDNIPDKCQTENNDCDGNGVPDDCDLLGDPDCNNNGILDFCDIDADTSEDCQPDGIPDECQLGTVPDTNVVQDPSFELGTPNAAWNEFSINFGTPLCDVGLCGTGTGTGPRTGLYWAWFGGISVPEEASVDQDVTIPVGTATLTFWLEQIVCDSAADFMEVLIDGNQVFVTDGSSPLCGVLGYSEQTVDVSAFADGGVHNLEFNSETFANNFGGSNFFVDDISLIVSGAGSNDCNGNGIPDDCDNCADLDGNGVVNATDYQLFRATYGRVDTDGAYNPCADYDDSGAVGLNDYQTWLDCYRDFIGNPFAGPPIKRPVKDVVGGTKHGDLALDVDANDNAPQDP